MTNLQRLDEVATIIMGQAPPGESYNTDGRGCPLIAGAGDFQNGRAVTKKYTTKATRLSQPGDIILSIRASIGDKITADGEYCLGRGVAGIRADAGVDPQFLWHWLTSVESELANKGKGATFKQVNRSDIGELPIALPPPEEQRRVAEVLDRTDELRTKRRKAIAHLDDLAQSVFIDMFGDSQISPHPRDAIPLGELGHIQGGLQVTAKRKSLPLEVPYLRVANVYRNRLELQEIKFIRTTERELERTQLQAGDLLIVEGHGNAKEVGRVAVWNGSIEPCTHQNHIIRVRLTGELLPTYACALLNSPGGRRHLLRAANTTSGLNTISSSDVRSAPVMVPPIDLQAVYADRLSTIEHLRMTYQIQLVELDRLFASLQARAFQDEL